MTLANTLADNKIQGIQFLELAQTGLIHGIKYWQILISIQLHKAIIERFVKVFWWVEFQLSKYTINKVFCLLG